MSEPLKDIAVCKCGCPVFFISEAGVQCQFCRAVYAFSYICDGICETKADDIKILIEEGY